MLFAFYIYAYSIMYNYCHCFSKFIYMIFMLLHLLLRDKAAGIWQADNKTLNKAVTPSRGHCRTTEIIKRGRALSALKTVA